MCPCKMTQVSSTPTKQEEKIMSDKQYKQLGCLDVDATAGCAFQVRAETEGELFQLVAMHAKHSHKIDSLPPEMVAKAKAAVKTVTVTV